MVKWKLLLPQPWEGAFPDPTSASPSSPLNPSCSTRVQWHEELESGQSYTGQTSRSQTHYGIFHLRSWQTFLTLLWNNKGLQAAALNRVSWGLDATHLTLQHLTRPTDSTKQSHSPLLPARTDSPSRCCDLASAGNKEPCGHSLTPSTSLVGWGGESEGKGQTHGLGWKQVNKIAKGEENNNNNMDKKNIQHATFSPHDAQIAPE